MTQVAERWKYGKEGTAFPVEDGSVWKVGGHVYVCSDLMDSELFDEVVAEEELLLVYCDPPWGQGLANGFRTKAGLERAEYDWTDIYRRVALLGHSHRIPVWVEGSVISSKFGAPIPQLISVPEGNTRRGYWEATYFGDNPYGIYYAGRTDHPAVSIEGLSGFKVVAEVLDQYQPKGAVVDACGGLGGVQLEAQKQGMRSLSNELSPYRTSKAMWRMRELTGAEPVRVK